MAAVDDYPDVPRGDQEIDSAGVGVSLEDRISLVTLAGHAVEQQDVLGGAQAELEFVAGQVAQAREQLFRDVLENDDDPIAQQARMAVERKKLLTDPNSQDARTSRYGEVERAGRSDYPDRVDRIFKPEPETVARGVEVITEEMERLRDSAGQFIVRYDEDSYHYVIGKLPDEAEDVVFTTHFFSHYRGRDIDELEATGLTDMLNYGSLLYPVDIVSTYDNPSSDPASLFRLQLDVSVDPDDSPQLRKGARHGLRTSEELLGPDETVDYLNRGAWIGEKTKVEFIGELVNCNFGLTISIYVPVFRSGILRVLPINHSYKNQTLLGLNNES